MDQNPALIDHLELPNSWEGLVAIKDIIPLLTNVVTRFPEKNQEYWDYIDQYSKEDRIQYILDMMGNDNQKITPNRFPYSRLYQNIPGVKHYVLWSKTDTLSDALIEEIVKKEFQNLEYFWFINPLNNKSLPEIWHCHIFVRK
jgi:hypothetical protein